jgi:hypothetical protein
MIAAFSIKDINLENVFKQIKYKDLLKINYHR